MHVPIVPPDRQGTVRLPGGRALAWSEWGPASGRTVLFCTGAGMSGWLGFGAADLADLGLRLLAIHRPGLGRSDNDPAGTLRSWAADVSVLIDAEGVREPLALGAAGAVRALAIVSGQDELRHPGLRGLLHPEVRGMVEAVERDRDAFRERIARSATREWLWEMIMGMSSPEDRAVYAQPSFADAYGRALEEGFARGAGPYARDLVNALGVWPAPPEEVEVPVDLWYGGRDASPVHSPDRGATLASRFPDATLTRDPDQGGSLLWTRSRDILTMLLARAGGASAAP